jgi:Sulfotransferase family
VVREGRFVRQALRHPGVLKPRIQGLLSPRTAFLERNHDRANTLLLVGSGRSGSTWLSEVLVETFSCRLIFEPFRRDMVPLTTNIRWGTYVGPGQADPEVQRVVERILTGRIRSRWTERFNVYRFPKRRLVKEIRTTNLLPYMRSAFPEVPMIYLLRHPVAAAWSSAELGWAPFLSEFVGQDRLMGGPLAPYRDVIARHGDDPDLFHRHVLRWCMENLVPITLLPPGSVHVVLYENLVEDPYGELARLADYLGSFGRGRWAFDPKTPTVDRLSRANYRHTPVMSASQRLESWVDDVPRPSVERAVALLEEFGLDRVYGASVRPYVTADNVLRGSPTSAETVASPTVQVEGGRRLGGAASSNSR